MADRYSQRAFQTDQPWESSNYRFQEVCVQINAQVYEQLSEFADLSITKKGDLYVFGRKYKNGNMRLKTRVTKNSVLNHKSGKLYTIVNISVEVKTEDSDYVHATIALINHKKHEIEYFDPNGGIEVDTSSFIKDFFSTRFDNYKFKNVNTKNLQKAESFGYCQTWTYYYIYNRLFGNNASVSILKRLRNMSSKERLEEIEHFWKMIFGKIPK